MEPTTQSLMEQARFFRSREAIEAAGFVPGWHGEPVAVGEQAVMYGRGQWRLCVVTKVTAKVVTGVYTTPGAIDYARSTHAGVLGYPAAKAGQNAAEQAARNWDWEHYVATHQPGDPWSPNENRARPMALNERVIVQSQAWLAEHPDRDAYIAAEREKRATEQQRDIDYATAQGVAGFVVTTNTTGRRDALKSNLYVRPR